MKRLAPLAARLLAAAVLASAPPAFAEATPSPGVAWRSAAGDADIDRAFAEAREAGKPLLLYWGASWCPPCNHLKATLFNRQDFIERSRAFVPVFVDGDGPGAQRLGARFKVRGYPTMVLMDPRGREITRLPGEADAPQVLALLQAGLAGGRPVAAVLADARAGQPLAAGEWRMLAYHSWATDDALADANERPGLLASLAAKAPEPEVATRLVLKALAESDDGRGIVADEPLRERMLQLFADPARSRAQMDVLVNAAPEIAKALEPDAGPARTKVVAALDAALVRLEADASLSRADRLSALAGRVELARLDAPKSQLKPTLPPALVARLERQVAAFDREIADGYERQAVITAAAWALTRAGRWDASDALLKANLAKSHSPYYLMSQLAGNARKLGRADEALGWYEKAWRASQGPATRLQWGASYVAALVDLAPRDEARIERSASALFADAAQPGSFYERSAASLGRGARKLRDWNRDGAHAAAIGRLRAQLDGVCAKLDAADPQRATCAALAKTLS